MLQVRVQLPQLYKFNRCVWLANGTPVKAGSVTNSTRFAGENPRHRHL